LSKLPFSTFKPWLILALFLIGWTLIPTLIKSFCQLSFYQFQAPLWTLTSQFKDLQIYWSCRNHSKKELIEACRDLARRNSFSQLAVAENMVLKEEIARFEKLHNLPALDSFDPVIARITRRDIHSWSHQFMIRKGSKDGITPGAAVIYEKGVVGRIKDVYPSSSIVELVSSPGFRIAARFVGDNRPITYKGIDNPAFSKPKGHAENIPIDLSIQPDRPTMLISSRLGGHFPDGLIIGKLSKLEPSISGLFNQGAIELDPHLHSLQEVTVLIPQRH